MPRFSRRRFGLDSGKAAIDRQVNTGDVAALVGGKEQSCRRDLFGKSRLRYYYAVEDKEFDQCNADLWLAGYRVLAAIWSAIILEQQFLLKERYLALFTEVFARLSRLLKAAKHFSAVSEKGTE